MNYFEVFGLPPKLAIDPAALERRFHQLSRQHHPDFFTTAPPEERARALRMTALLNDANRTLRHPTRRVEYLVSLYGLKSDKVPQSLLMEVFELNERLEEARHGNLDTGELDSLHALIAAKRQQFQQQLEVAAAEWDRLVDHDAPEPERRKQAEKLAVILSESAYIANLEQELERCRQQTRN